MESKKTEDIIEESTSFDLESLEQRLKVVEESLKDLIEETRILRTELFGKKNEKNEQGWFYFGIILSSLVGLLTGLWIEYLLKVFEQNLPENSWFPLVVGTSLLLAFLFILLVREINKYWG